MATVAELVAHLRADATQYNAEMAKAQASTKSVGGGMETMAKVGKVALFGIAGAAAATAVVAVKAAMEQETATRLLRAAVESAGQSYGQYADRIGAAEKKAISLGFADEDLDNGLAKLVRSTKDTGKSIELMGLAEDIARGRHMSLSAATDILVKVEAGRVGLLGRLGINTKDATGATISQEEAIKRLTALYGGDAKAYTETFAGKIEVLKARMGELAEDIGFVLIPIIEAMMTAVADTIGWFEQHTAAAIALGVVIGGPLVAAIGIYIVQTAIAAAETSYLLALFAVDKVVAFMGAVQMAGIAMSEFAGAETLAGIAADAATGSLLGFAAGLGAIVAAVAIPVALVASLTAVIIGTAYALGYFDDTVDKAAQAGDQWASGMVKQITHSYDLAGQVKQLSLLYNTNERELKTLQEQTDVSTTAGQRWHNELVNGSASALHMQETIDRLTHENKVYGAELDILRPKLIEQKKKTDEAKASLDVMAHTLGVTIPAAVTKGMDSSALKAFQSAVNDAVGQFGVGTAQMMVDAGGTASAIEAVVKHVQSMDQATTQAVQGFTSLTGKFGDATTVGEQDVLDFVNSTRDQVTQWAADMQSLSAAGVDQGIIEQLRQAGPKSEPLVQTLLQMVADGSIAVVNDTAAKIQEVTAILNSQLDAAAVASAVKIMEQTTVAKAAYQDLQEGGTSHLQALEASSDKTVAAMAYVFALKVNEMQNSVDGLHGKGVPVWMDGVQAFLDNAARIAGAIEGIPGAVVMTASGVAAAEQHQAVFGPIAAHGLVAMAGGGVAGRMVNSPTMALIGEAGREAVLPLTRFSDMVATIKNTGMANRVAAAAVAAGGGGTGHGVSTPGGGGGMRAYYIDVKVAPGGNPTETGRQIITAIKQFEISNGTAWRSN